MLLQPFSSPCLSGGSVVTSGIVDSQTLTSSRVVAVSLAHGLTISVLVAATSPISGGHVNPAVSFGLALTGHVSWMRAYIYTLAQLLGAIIGAALISTITNHAMDASLGVHALGQDVTHGQGMITEVYLICQLFPFASSHLYADCADVSACVRHLRDCC